MASGDGDYACVSVAQYRGEWTNYDFEMKGLDTDADYTAEYYLTDDRHHFAPIRTDENLPHMLRFGTYLKENSVLTIKIRKKS
jgi:hypothetical protein